MERMKTRGLKARDLRPCAKCGGKIAPIFHVVEIKMAAINPQNANALLGMNTMFGGNALGLAEVFSTGPIAEVCEDQEAITTLYLCSECYCYSLNLAVLAEQADKAKDKQESTTPP